MREKLVKLGQIFIELARFAQSFLPTALPVGLSDFNEWANSIIRLAGAFADENSMKFALASMVIHLDRDTAYVSKRWFVKCLRKAAANQVASAVFQDIKERQQKQQEAIAATKPEDTASAQAPTDGAPKESQDSQPVKN